MGVPKNEPHPNATKAFLSEKDMAIYRAVARLRVEQEGKELAVRRERARETARRAAKLLKDSFGAQRVVVFGSLLRPECFNKWSDVASLPGELALKTPSGP